MYYILSENDNLLRTSNSRSRQYPDDCGAWHNERTVNTPFVFRENKTMKSLILKKEGYCTEKTISGQRIYEKVEPQPSSDQLVVFEVLFNTQKQQQLQETNIKTGT